MIDGQSSRKQNFQHKNKNLNYFIYVCVCARRVLSSSITSIPICKNSTTRYHHSELYKLENASFNTNWCAV